MCQDPSPRKPIVLRPGWHLTPVAPPNHLKRLAWLLACFCTGLVIALVGEALTGHKAWYLAIPALIAAGWLVVANPTECEPQQRRDVR